MVFTSLHGQVRAQSVKVHSMAEKKSRNCYSIIWALKTNKYSNDLLDRSTGRNMEKFMQMLKRCLRAIEGDGKSISHRLAGFLLNY